MPALGGSRKIDTVLYFEDKFYKKYQNVLNVAVKWVGDTLKVELPKRVDPKFEIPNFFWSQFGSKDRKAKIT